MRTAERESVLAVLAALGEPVGGSGDAAEALERRRADRAQRLLEPVIVAWDGAQPPIEVRLPARRPKRLLARLELEGGGERSWSVRTDDVSSDGRTATLRIDTAVPLGRHALTVEAGRRVGRSTMIAAPRHVMPSGRPRDWGVFLPLHALVTERTWGIGDLSGLSELAGLVRGLGGGLVATLPLLAAFPGEASPYRPASRLFWNEIYLDLGRVPEVERDPAIRRFVRSSAFERELASVRAGDLVDHARVLALKRRVLERVAGALEDPRAAALRRFLREHPDVETYARFRAAGERFGLDVRRWPAGARAGRIRASDVDPVALGYHRVAQWLAEEQVGELGRTALEGGAGLYLDMPLGVHPDGYDVWRHPTTFATSVSVGAPPDDFFPKGQVWGFPPLHPERVREDGYAYPLACLRHAFRHAGVMRIDHAIGLHRQYWVPEGAPADRGVFVRYPAEEWYATISLEAHRTGTVVVGEDLGTVPGEVRRGLARHRLLRSYVLELETVPERPVPVPAPTAGSLACMNTHDLPTFAAFWRGADIAERLEAGLIDAAQAEAERRRRGAMREDLARALVDSGVLEPADASDERAVRWASHVWLASSPARLVVVNLEDLWGETHQQNVPGTSDRPNWRRRSARSLEELRRSPEVLELLRLVDAARREALVTEGDAA
jgi:4-alpha-glucanotransferase